VTIKLDRVQNSASKNGGICNLVAVTSSLSLSLTSMSLIGRAFNQGCSLGLERLGLETFFGMSRSDGLVSNLKVDPLGLESLENSNVSVSSWS